MAPIYFYPVRRYARTAKKIDIKALKEAIWDRVAGPSPPPGADGGEGGHLFTSTLESIPVERFPEVRMPAQPLPLLTGPCQK